MAFAFNEVSEKQFTWLLTRYPSKQAVLLPGLRLIEAQLGEVSPEAIDYLAGRLGLAPAFAHGVFTFYGHYRRPGEGKYIVQVCHTLPCALRGACNILNHFKEELKLGVGETSSDKMFSLKKVECLGACSLAPVAQINDDYYENLDAQKVKEIVADLREGKSPARHLSAGPTLEGGCKGYTPLVDASAGK